jgi:hypothetical protein
MQRKHYNAIAAALRSGKATEDLITTIAEELCMDSDLFNQDLFIDKAMNGPTMEQRSTKYRTQLKYLERLRRESRL